MYNRLFVVISIAVFALNFSASAKTSPSAVAAGSKAKTTTPSAKVSVSPVQESFFADFEYELQTGVSSAGIESTKVGGDTITSIGGQASVTKVIRSNIQAGVEAQFLNQSGNGSSSYFEVMGLGIYNLNNNLKESLYGKVGLGMLNVVNDKRKNESKFAVLIGGGKRIPIMEKVAYTPEARIILVDGATRFQILALNFSLFY